MEFKKVTVNNYDCLFACESQNTRNGFKHVVSFVDKGYEYKATCYYLNRTWEKYSYQSAMIKAVNEALLRVKIRIEYELKERNGWKKITAKRRDLIDVEINRNPTVVLYRALIDTLNNGLF